MRDIFVVISQKEAELKRLQQELETLRAAAKLLVEESEGGTHKISAASDNNLSVVGETSHKEVRVAAGGLQRFP